MYLIMLAILLLPKVVTESQNKPVTSESMTLYMLRTFRNTMTPKGQQTPIVLELSQTTEEI